MFQCYKLSGNLYKAIDAHERYVHLKDSLFSVEMGKELKRLQNNHEIYQKQKEIELLEKDKLLQEETIAMHALQRNILIIGILVILAFSWMMYRNMQKTKILNNTLILQKQEIEQQKEEILAQSEALKESNLKISQANDELNAMLNTVSEQKNIIEEKNQNIVDSLNYAKRIQTAMLPKGEEIAVFFPEHFVFFKPKDIVSGDFYWMAHTTAEPIYE
ncbi:MAG: hypothetical protein RMJ89_13390, partial [Flammeovirgaceae bacterium]|nr:hypothetical protein [Flammeovirgaceae bacterium]